VTSARKRESESFGPVSCLTLSKSTPVFVPSLEKNPDFFARFESLWCWTCGKVTNHEITWRWGGKCFMCKVCANIVVEKL